MAAALTDKQIDRLAQHLSFLYGASHRDALLQRLNHILERHQAQSSPPPKRAGPLNERDAIVITYGDMVQHPGQAPLATLATFFDAHLHDLVSGIHILPFFPYSSDDGFSVIDYREVNPDLGTWDHIHSIAGSFRLMVDAVINHISAKSDWFEGFLAGESAFEHTFITVDPNSDLSAVVRPRDLPLLTPVKTPAGERHVWTTFSADQIDLNFANPDVMLEILDLLLFYVRNGAQLIRLDAIAFLWKEIGTSCIHLPQTHRAVKLMREVLEAVAPWVYIITETNVPHEENISYFGNGKDEAHLVYQFALPPLVLHTLLTGDASHLSAWADDLSLPSEHVTFFNFLASHDGIGLRPVQDILPQAAIEHMVAQMEARAGGISYRRVGEKQRSPYELNINYFDALADPRNPDPDSSRNIDRFLASQAIMLTLIGVPGIYFHSLFGSRNDPDGVSQTGSLRAINREKLQRKTLEAELARPHSLRSRIFSGYARLLQARARQPAFDPYGEQQVLDLGSPVFALIRRTPGTGERILCLHEVSGKAGHVSIPLAEAPQASPKDILTGEVVSLERCELTPYQVRWIQLDVVDGK